MMTHPHGHVCLPGLHITTFLVVQKHSASADNSNDMHIDEQIVLQCARLREGNAKLCEICMQAGACNTSICRCLDTEAQVYLSRQLLDEGATNQTWAYNADGYRYFGPACRHSGGWSTDVTGKRYAVASSSTNAQVCSSTKCGH